jgi:hypothetical protein
LPHHSTFRAGAVLAGILLAGILLAGTVLTCIDTDLRGIGAGLAVN